MSTDFNYLRTFYINEATGEGVVNEDYRFKLPAKQTHDVLEDWLCIKCGELNFEYTEESVRNLVREALQATRQVNRAKIAEAQEKEHTEQYLSPVEKCTDADLLLRLIEDDNVDAFRAGINNQVYIIVPRADDTGKEQLSVPSEDFNAYARRVFARDHERIERLIVLQEQINTISGKIKKLITAKASDDNSSDDDIAKLKDDLKSFQQEYVTLAKNYKETYGHRPVIHGRVVSDENIKSVGKQLRTFATAYRELYVRSFANKKGWYYDLQNDRYEYIAIEEGKYAIRDDAYYYFRRPTRQGSNDRPESCDESEGMKAFDFLFQDFNFVGPDGSKHNEEQKSLNKIFNLWLFYNDHRTMRPIESIMASPNSGKTTLAKIQKMLYDPSKSFGALVKTWGSGKKDERRDRFVVAASHAFTIFDNVKSARSDEQDDMCVMSTGGALPSRMLYTNADVHELEIQTNIGYTSVNDIATFPDLIRRQIQFKLDESQVAINEDLLFDSLQENRPKILHWIFTTLAKAQRSLEQVNANEYTKFMGLWKFVMIGDAIAEAMGEDKKFVSKLFENIPMQQALRAVENDAFANAFLLYIMNSPEMKLTLTANKIKTNVEEYCAANKDYTSLKDPFWPANARAISSKLEYLRPTFKTLQVELERGDLIHGYRPWVITKQLGDEDKPTSQGKGDDKDDGNDESKEVRKPRKFTVERHQMFGCPYCIHEANTYDLLERHAIQAHHGKPFTDDYHRRQQQQEKQAESTKQGN